MAEGAVELAEADSPASSSAGFTVRKSERKPWVLPGVLVVAAFFFRIILGYVFTYYGGDARSYTPIGENLAAFHGYSMANHAPYLPSDVRLPAYPFALAIGFLFSDSHWTVIVVNALLGAVSTLLIWLISQALGLSRTRALWATGIAAFFFCTASEAGIAQSEALSVPAVLAFTYFILIKPRKTLPALFIGGSALAWVAALTRPELIFFVLICAVVAAKRLGLRPVVTIALVVCFGLGSGLWVVRNQVQVHRTEYVDSLSTDAVIVASVNGQLDSPLYKKGGRLIREGAISQSARAEYQRETYAYAKNILAHHFGSFLGQKVKYQAESVFPIPLYGLVYNSSTNVLGWMAWSLVLLVGYALATVTVVRWWTRGRRRDVVSILLFPAFIFCFEFIFDPQYRFWYPALLLLLPLAVEGANRATLDRLFPKPVPAPPADQPAQPDELEAKPL